MVAQMKLTHALAALTLGLLVTTSSISAEDAQFTDEQKSAIEAIIKDYIMANPEIIPEAVELAEKVRQERMVTDAQKALEDNWDLIAKDPLSYVAGNPEGDVTIVEFFDYNCGWCKRATPVMMELLESDKNIRMVFKEFPIRGKESDETARAAVAAIKQGKYFELHQTAMNAEGEMTLERFLDLAEDVDLDMDQLKKDMEDPKVEEVLGTNYALAELLYIEGTPSFVVGDTIVRGWPGKEGMEALIAQTRASKVEAEAENAGEDEPEAADTKSEAYLYEPG